MTVTLMATCSFSAANIVFFSEKQGKNVYFRITNADILGWRICKSARTDNVVKARIWANGALLSAHDLIYQYDGDGYPIQISTESRIIFYEYE